MTVLTGDPPRDSRAPGWAAAPVLVRVVAAAGGATALVLAYPALWWVVPVGLGPMTSWLQLLVAAVVACPPVVALVRPRLAVGLVAGPLVLLLALGVLDGDGDWAPG